MYILCILRRENWKASFSCLVHFLLVCCIIKIGGIFQSLYSAQIFHWSLLSIKAKVSPFIGHLNKLNGKNEEGRKRHFYLSLFCGRNFSFWLNLFSESNKFMKNGIKSIGMFFTYFFLGMWILVKGYMGNWI